jgi:hypothetical protein
MVPERAGPNGKSESGWRIKAWKSHRFEINSKHNESFNVIDPNVQNRHDRDFPNRPSLRLKGKRLSLSGLREHRRNNQLHQMWQAQTQNPRDAQTLPEFAALLLL